MDAGVMVVLATLGFVVVVIVSAMVVDLVREARARARTRAAQEGLAAHSHARPAVGTAGATAKRLVGQTAPVDQPQNVVVASAPPDLAATAPHRRRAS